MIQLNHICCHYFINKGVLWLVKKYKIIMMYSDGINEELDESFNSCDAAEEYARYMVSCSEDGAETLNLSNPGDYSLDDYDEPEFEIIEIDV